jgi:N-acetylglucosaminyldiphosphoundecaprenol N-acetyl-beta-D-mannosaminyltransferase
MFGLALDYCGIEEFADAFMAKAQSGVGGYCCVTNVHQCMLVHEDADFRDLVNGADFTITDSVILQRSRVLLHKVPLLPVLRGADLMKLLCARAARLDVPVALVGGRDDDVLADLRTRLGEAFPALKIVYVHAPPFRPASMEVDKDLVGQIKQSGARIVFVGLGCPKQEMWMAAHWPHLNAMLIGVGAAFDTNSGLVPAAPAFVHWLGFEWLYRLVCEPRRLWRRYLTSSPRFVRLLVLALVRRPAGFHDK